MSRAKRDPNDKATVITVSVVGKVRDLIKGTGLSNTELHRAGLIQVMENDWKLFNPYGSSKSHQAWAEYRMIKHGDSVPDSFMRLLRWVVSLEWTKYKGHLAKGDLIAGDPVLQFKFEGKEPFHAVWRIDGGAPLPTNLMYAEELDSVYGLKLQKPKVVHRDLNQLPQPLQNLLKLAEEFHGRRMV